MIHRLRGMLKKAEVKHEPIDMNEPIASNLRLLQSEIIDRGSGLPPSREHKVFSHFLHTKKRGLGLSICTPIVNLHGGTLSLQNDVREGASAIFRLPPPLD